MRTLRTSTLPAIVGCALLTGATQAQNFRLDLFLTARSIGSDPQRTLTDIGTGGTVQVSPGRYRVELRYFIQDLTADMITSRGLARADIRFTITGATGPIVRAPITQHEVGPGDGPTGSLLDPDASGVAPGMTGLIGPYRSGLLSDSDAGNGVPSSAGWNIVPNALVPPDHLSWTAACPPPAVCAPNPLRRFGLYAFEFDFAGTPVQFNASAVANALTGERSSYFARNHSTGATTLTANNLATDGTLGFVVPGSPAAMMTLAGLSLVGRRRRGR